MARIVFFGTGPFSQIVFERIQNEHEVLAVVTPPDSLVGRRQQLTPCELAAVAVQENIFVQKPERLKNNTEFAEWLAGLNPDVCVIAAYGKIIPKELLAVPKLGWVNVHPSLLPQLRGASPIQAVLLQGLTQTGTSIMLMDEEVDHGPVFAQASVEIDPQDTYPELRDKLASLSGELLSQVLKDLEYGTAHPVVQDHEQATFVKRVTKDDGRTDWRHTAVEIYNQWRAYTPWPGLWTTWQGQKLKILKCDVSSDLSSRTSASADLGRDVRSGIHELEKAQDMDSPLHGNNSNMEAGLVLEGGKVACGDGSMLELLEVQLEGKNSTEIKSFLNGHQDFVGSTLS